MSDAETNRDSKEVILAEGEATGHAHRAVGSRLRFTGGELDVPVSATITHDEHKTRVLLAEDYTVRRVVELDPAGDKVEVRD